MWKSIKTTVIPATPEFVRRFRELPRYKGDRADKHENQKEYLEKLKKGKFHAPEFAIITVNGQSTRINGNNSSKALMMAHEQGVFPTDLHIIQKSFQGDTEKDIEDCWQQFDSPRAARNMADLHHAAAKVHQELVDLKGTHAKRISSGLTYRDSIRKGISDQHKLGTSTMEERLACLHSNVDFYSWANKYAKVAIFERAPVIAAMFDTFKKDPDDASKFWKAVKDDDGLSTSPHRALHRHLSNTSCKTRVIGRSGSGPSPQPLIAFYVRCILAWNAFRRNQPTADLKFYPGSYCKTTTTKDGEQISDTRKIVSLPVIQ